MTKVLDNLSLKIGRAHPHLEGDGSPTDPPYGELVVDTNSNFQYATQSIMEVTL